MNAGKVVPELKLREEKGNEQRDLYSNEKEKKGPSSVKKAMDDRIM